MNIKLIVFDLDGVLVDSRNMHYESLNMALKEFAPTYVISKDEHLSTFDGLSTTKKLALLSKRGLDPNLHSLIWHAKQKYTHQIIETEYVYDERIRIILSELKRKDIIIHVASNSIHSTVKQMLLKKGFMEYVDYFASNECVRLPKPSPEIYFHCMSHAGVSVQQTLILEDSHIGRMSAISSGAHLLPIENTEDLSLDKIIETINLYNKPVKEPGWMGRCNVIIPMAGYGSRFESEGYKMPKPLIDVKGKPMIQVVVDNLGFEHTSNVQFIFIVRQEHIQLHHIDYILRLISPTCIIISTDKVVEGSACSILLAKEYIDNDRHLFIANSDQFVEWNVNEFMYSMIENSVDGGIATFEADSLKWSYAKIGENGYVNEVAEKNRISNHATVGFYYWKRGSDFVTYANKMISKNKRVNNEFYTCPVYNEAIEEGLKIKIFDIKRMWGLGVPDDLRYFLENYSKI